ncbi:MAG: hypothetical protein U5L07_09055 [Desulfobacterales bacterium]|nr:hypothetical protein [Desulfobacterales bacterium]
MKKKMMIAITTLIALGLIAGVAWACPQCGYHGGRGWNGNPGYNNNTAPNSQQFNNETASLREELAAKRGEYNALMARDNPDPKRAARLQKEITRLHNQIQSKAQAYNMPHAGGPSNQGASHGRNWNHNGRWCW